MIGRILLFVVACAIACPLVAQEPTEGQMQAAARLIDVMHYENSWGSVSEQIIQGIYPPGSDTSKFVIESQARMREMFAKQFRWQDLKPEYVRLYASLYTEAELRQLIAFYESPVGQKMMRLGPQMTARLLAITQRRMMAVAPS